ncbi:nucleotide exchange factor GrpE [Rubeoparvulum massiliense]|uniref:nucleotide exchange factor GrpE n=1 Tax=Rubeoparvulum massiliense TaxID=1631346 RepID=UPI00069D0DBD|nr:nucleotide exchange factor GrpE [Rubeoparvulum massiliense]
MDEQKDLHQAEPTVEGQPESREELKPEQVEEVNADAHVSNEEAQAEFNRLQAELTRVQLESDEHYQRMLRLQADFDNFRRRTRTEKADLIKSANASLLEALLPVLDNLERAIQSGSQHLATDDPFVEGVKMVQRQMLEIFAQHGVEPMETIGKPFDPYMHQAVMQEASDQFESGSVMDEFQKGYTLHGKVLRVAMVKVAE